VSVSENQHPSLAKKSAPGKPIPHIVLSYYHDDHMGGVRTYAAEGRSSPSNQVPAITSARCSLNGVRLNRLEIACRDGQQSQPAVMLVHDVITLTYGTREIKLYHAPNVHSSGMLVGYVPDARVLFTADLVGDTFPLIPALVGP
jgi:glyoxylase-like metal-dependent hydrolase (beta-lactamase superfamily II)